MSSSRRTKGLPVSFGKSPRGGLLDSLAFAAFGSEAWSRAASVRVRVRRDLSMARFLAAPARFRPYLSGKFTSLLSCLSVASSECPVPIFLFSLPKAASLNFVRWLPPSLIYFFSKWVFFNFLGLELAYVALDVRFAVALRYGGLKHHYRRLHQSVSRLQSFGLQGARLLWYRAWKFWPLRVAV